MPLVNAAVMNAKGKPTGPSTSATRECENNFGFIFMPIYVVPEEGAHNRIILPGTGESPGFLEDVAWSSTLSLLLCMKPCSKLILCTNRRVNLPTIRLLGAQELSRKGAAGPMRKHTLALTQHTVQLFPSCKFLLWFLRTSLLGKHSEQQAGVNRMSAARHVFSTIQPRGK